MLAPGGCRGPSWTLGPAGRAVAGAGLLTGKRNGASLTSVSGCRWFVFPDPVTCLGDGKTGELDLFPPSGDSCAWGPSRVGLRGQTAPASLGGGDCRPGVALSPWCVCASKPAPKAPVCTWGNRDPESLSDTGTQTAWLHRPLPPRHGARRAARTAAGAHPPQC